MAEGKFVRARVQETCSVLEERCLVATKEILLVHYLISELGAAFSLVMPIPLFGDNQAANKFGEERSVNDRVKHIDLRHDFLLTMVEDRVISMNYVNTTENIADIFTKPLNAETTDHFLTYMIGDIQPKLKLLTDKLLLDNAHRHKHL